jgi:acyl carrier protein
MYSLDDVRQSVNEMIVEILALEPEEIRPDARFFADLDGESIDLLELSFRCNKTYKHSVEFQKMLMADQLDVDPSGRLRESSLALIQEKYPFIDLTEYARDPQLDQIQDLLTVDVLAQFVHRVVNTPAAPDA